MSETKTLTEREAVLRERVSFARGLCASQHEMHVDDPCDAPCQPCLRRARQVYKLPKNERPRVVEDPESGCWEFRVVGGMMQARTRKPVAGEWEWEYANTFGVCPSRVRVWSDLYANPFELVEAGS